MVKKSKNAQIYREKANNKSTRSGGHMFFWEGGLEAPNSFWGVWRPGLARLGSGGREDLPRAGSGGLQHNQM